jgi:hypothetical protein
MHGGKELKQASVLILIGVLCFSMFQFVHIATMTSEAPEGGRARGVDSFAGADSTSLTSNASIGELSWTEGEPFPVVDGRVMFPALHPSELTPPNYNAHWYAGSVYPQSLAPQNASTISMSITVPSSAPRSDEFYYVVLSAWDNNGSYNQIGFSDSWGIWGLTYSWSTTDLYGKNTHNYLSNAMALSLGAT